MAPSPSARLRAFLVALGATAAAGLYTDGSEVALLDKAGFLSQVQTTSQPYVVHFFESGSAADEAAASELAKVAETLRKYGVGLAAVDCGAAEHAKWCKKEQLRPMEPSLRLFVTPPEQNPYRKRMERTAAYLGNPSGTVTSRVIKKGVLDALPNHVRRLGAEDTPAEGAVLAVVLSDREKTSPLLKSLALGFQGRGVEFWELHEREVESEAVADVGLSVELRAEAGMPALFVRAADGAWEVFGGDVKDREAMAAFLEPFATTAATGGSGPAAGTGAKSSDAPDTAAPGGAVPEDETFWQLDATTYESEVAGGDAAWVVVLVPAAQSVVEACPDWASLKTKVGGQLALGYVDCGESAALCAAKGVTETAQIEAWPFGREDKEDYGASTFVPADASKAVDEAGGSVPEVFQRLLGGSAQMVEAFLSMTLAEQKLALLVFSAKEDAPLSIRLLAQDLADHTSVLFVAKPADGLKQHFSVRKLPTVLLLAEPPTGADAQLDPEGRAQLSMSAYDPRFFGGFKVQGLQSFVLNTVAQVDMSKAMALMKAKESLNHKRHGKSFRMGDEETSAGAEAAGAGPLGVDAGADEGLLELTPELSPDFAPCAGTKPCALLLTDGPLSDAYRDLLEEVRGGTNGLVRFVHADATCHADFAAAFDVTEGGMLPALVVWSGKKAVYARYVGALGAEPVARFVQSALRGTTRSLATSGTPAMADVGACLSGGNADEAAPEDDAEDLGDLMAEIRAEEEKAAEALREEIAREAREKKEAEAAAAQAALEEKAREELKKRKKRKKKKKKKAGDEL